MKKPLKVTVTILTGLHIGGSHQSRTIGGLDNEVIKDPIRNRPYIPGSSLKGKVRALLEMKDKKFTQDGKPCNCGSDDCEICRVFGMNVMGKSTNQKPTRVIFRDALLIAEDRDEFDNRQSKGLPNFEIKTETAINRLEGKAQHGSLRNQERVPPGWRFEFELIYRDYLASNDEELKQDLNLLKRGLEMLANDALGKAGSRGYGQVELSYDDESWFEQV